MIIALGMASVKFIAANRALANLNSPAPPFVQAFAIA